MIKNTLLEIIVFSNLCIYKNRTITITNVFTFGGTARIEIICTNHNTVELNAAKNQKNSIKCDIEYIS